MCDLQQYKHCIDICKITKNDCSVIFKHNKLGTFVVITWKCPNHGDNKLKCSGYMFDKFVKSNITYIIKQ